MSELIKQIVEKTGVPAEQAQQSNRRGGWFCKTKIPPTPVARSIFY